MNNEMTITQLQRAALFGAFSAILETQEDKTIDEIKIAICNLMEHLIEHEIIIGDEIEIDVITRCKNYVEQQIAVETVKELI